MTRSSSLPKHMPAQNNLWQIPGETGNFDRHLSVCEEAKGLYEDLRV